MSAQSPGSLETGDHEESNPPVIGRQTANIPDVRPKETSAYRRNHDDTTQTTAPPHHLTTALSIEKSHTLDRNNVEFVFPRELAAPAEDKPVGATTSDGISDESFISEVLQDHKYYCVVCENLMLEPLAIKVCIHSICEQCFILQSQKEGQRTKCTPGDRGPGTHVGLTANQVFKDKHLQEEIQSRKIYCPNKKFGCTCTSEIFIRNIKEHLLDVCSITRPPSIDDIASNLITSIPHPSQSEQQVQRPGGSSTSLLSMVALLQTLSMKVNLAKEKYVPLKDELQKVDSSNLKLRDEVKILKEERTKLESERDLFVRKVGKNDQEIVLLKNSAYAWREAVTPRDPQRTQHLINHVAVMNNTINDLDLRLQCQENASYDGKLIWKINNFREHMDRADGVESLFSQPFYDSARGYKMCCRLYLKGRRTRQDTIEDNVADYISVYFVIMRGTYDDLLEWPFRKTITITLKHVEEGGLDIARLIVPNMAPDINDPRNKEFGKPRTELNKAVGFQKFLLRTQLGNYIKNGSLYIFCKVE